MTVHSADRVAEFVERGLRIATSGRPGPVMLALPADILAEEIPAPRARTRSLRPAGTQPEEVQHISRLLEQARSPVVIAGEGAGGARQELISFAEAFDVQGSTRRSAGRTSSRTSTPCTWGTSPWARRRRSEGAGEPRTWCSSRAPASTR